MLAAVHRITMASPQDPSHAASPHHEKNADYEKIQIPLLRQPFHLMFHENTVASLLRL
jgi:hypothetical protein